MTSLLLASALFIIGIALLYDWLKRKEETSARSSVSHKAFKQYRPKVDPQEPWVQVFETSEKDEVVKLKARLEEEDIKAILFEQAKKDLQGGTPPGIGLA